MGVPTVSVVIPSYNGTTYIRDALHSIFAQTSLPTEIVVVDDESTDDTVAVVEALASRAPVPLRVLRTPRNSGGPARPINLGVDAATSDLIAVLEQDDRMAPTRLARSRDATSASPSAGLICGRVRVRSPAGTFRDDPWKDGRRQFDDLPLTRVADRLYRADPHAVLHALLSRNIVVSNSNAVFPRAIWKRVGGFDDTYRICSDLDFNLKVARVAPFSLIDEVLCDYHERRDSLYNTNVLAAGESPAHLEAAFIRMRHALQCHEPSSAVAAEWYWKGRYLLGSAWKRHQWRRCASILALLTSSGVLRNRVSRKIRRLLTAASAR